MIDVVVVMMINLLLMIKNFNFRRECFFTFGTGNEWTCHLIDSLELGVSEHYHLHKLHEAFSPTINALQTHDKKQELIIMLLEERVKLSELMWPHRKHHSSSPIGTGSIPTKSNLFSAGLVKNFNQKGY